MIEKTGFGIAKKTPCFHNGMKLGVSYKRIIAKFTNVWKLNNILPNRWVKEEIRKEIKYLEMNENGNTTQQNLQAAARAILRGKFIATNTYIKKKDLKQPTFTPQEAEKERTKVRRKKR